MIRLFDMLCGDLNMPGSAINQIKSKLSVTPLQLRLSWRESMECQVAPILDGRGDCHPAQGRACRCPEHGMMARSRFSRKAHRKRKTEVGKARNRLSINNYIWEYSAIRDPALSAYPQQKQTESCQKTQRDDIISRRFLNIFLKKFA